MFRGLWKLTWLEIKIFLREPMGAFGTVIMPFLIFVIASRLTGGPIAAAPRDVARFVRTELPVLVAVLIAFSTVLSLVTIIAIYRENGILKRLRATPLRPWTILSAHVLAKLILTAVTLTLMIVAGRRYFPEDGTAPIASFGLAVLISTWSILSLGFIIASLVPTARFAQTIGALLLYPMIPLSGLLFPVEALPPALRVVARMLPLTYAVSLLQGIWRGDAWLAHVRDVGALVLVFVVCAALSSRMFRWE